MIPIIYLVGDNPCEGGRVHGEVQRSDIEQNLDTNFRRFAAIGGMPEAILSESEKWIPYLERLDPGLATELKGVSESFRFPLREITKLNVRYVLYFE